MILLEPDAKLNGDEFAPGYRAGATAVVHNSQGEILLFQRSSPADGNQRWQFPQGGLQAEETPRQALLRELTEETGLAADQVQVTAWLDRWLNYDLPEEMRANSKKKDLKGQWQAWFLLAAKSQTIIDLAKASDQEFNAWQWAAPADAIELIIAFKRASYAQALHHFASRAMRDFACWQGLPAN